MNLAIGTLTMGFVLGLLALGVFVSYRVLDTLDLTADGAFGLGVAVTAALIHQGMSPELATFIGALAGGGAGVITGVMHTALGVDTILAGILTSTGLYSAILYIMGGGDLSIAGQPTLLSFADRMWGAVFGTADVTLLGTTVSAASLATLVFVLAHVLVVGFLLDRFFRTDIGLAMRATGDNTEMARAQAIGVGGMTVLGLGVANLLIALSGALFTQYLGFANIQMGIGQIVTGLACVLLGEALVGRRSITRRLAGAILGTVAFRVLVAAALRSGLDPNSLKLVTAVFVLLALVGPRVGKGARGWRARTRSADA